MNGIKNKMSNETKFNNITTSVLIGLVVIIILILGFLVVRAFMDNKANEESVSIAEDFDKKVADSSNNSDEEKLEASGAVAVNSVDPEDVTKNNRKGSRIKSEGYDVVGTLRIPKINIKYPILYPSDARSLEKGLTLLESATGINKSGNTTILGHNYRNNMYFSKLHTLTNGDKIYVKDLDGVEVEYTIYFGEMKKPNDGDYIRRDTKGKTEISLSTCNTDSSLRYVVFAKKTGE